MMPGIFLLSVIDSQNELEPIVKEVTHVRLLRLDIFADGTKLSTASISVVETW
jgi:hypothetical protein